MGAGAEFAGHLDALDRCTIIAVYVTGGQRCRLSRAWGCGMRNGRKHKVHLRLHERLEQDTKLPPRPDNWTAGPSGQVSVSGSEAVLCAGPTPRQMGGLVPSIHRP